MSYITRPSHILAIQREIERFKLQNYDPFLDMKTIPTSNHWR